MRGRVAIRVKTCIGAFGLRSLHALRGVQGRCTREAYMGRYRGDACFEGCTREDTGEIQISIRADQAVVPGAGIDQGRTRAGIDEGED